MYTSHDAFTRLYGSRNVLSRIHLLACRAKEQSGRGAAASHHNQNNIFLRRICIRYLLDTYRISIAYTNRLWTGIEPIIRRHPAPLKAPSQPHRNPWKLYLRNPCLISLTYSPPWHRIPPNMNSAYFTMSMTMTTSRFSVRNLCLE